MSTWPVTPSFAFSAGVLDVQTPHAKMRIQWLPYPTAEELLPGGRRWRTFWPEFRLLRPQEPAAKRAVYALDLHVDDAANVSAEQKATAFALFRNALPPDIVRIVEPFGSHQWALMVAMHGRPPVMDLAANSPVLAYAMANSDQLMGTLTKEFGGNVRTYSQRKQREILGWLGFPDSEAVVRLMRKIPPEAVSPSVLRCLRNAMKTDNRVSELLAHVRAINAEVLDLVINHRTLAFVTPKLLQDVSERDLAPGEVSASDMILESLAVMREMSETVDIQPLSNVRQVQRLREKVDIAYQEHLQRQETARLEAQRAADEERLREEEVRRQQQRRMAATVEKTPFPPPPLPGTKEIVPITSIRELRAEGKDQHNCVGSYGWRVLLGNTYFYRVIAPQRATLMIVRFADGSWHRSEFKGTNNVDVGKATIRPVDAWLAAQRVSV